MEQIEKLNNYKKEFADEIDESLVSIEELKKLKISVDTLAAEVLLRKIFGDEIYQAKKAEEKIGGEKEIVKLDEEDIKFDARVRDICDNISDFEFDSNIGAMLLKVSQEEDE